MKTKLFLMSATLLAALSLTGVASADTTRDQIEAEGNQQIQAYWNEYQQALQDRQNAWEQSHGDIYTPAWQDANAHAGAAYREWLEARTALGDRLHAYDVAQWEKESDQPSNQTPVDDSQVPEENSQALNTQGSQATVPTSQSATPASQVKLSSQPATQELTQQASVADPASQPITQSTAQKPQQVSVSVQADKTGNFYRRKIKSPYRSVRSKAVWLHYRRRVIKLGLVRSALELHQHWQCLDWQVLNVIRRRRKMITIDLDNKFAIVSDGEVLNLVHKDGKMRKNGTPSGQKWWFQTYGQAVKFYEKKVDAGKPIHSLRELAKQIDSGYKRIEIMVDQKLKEAGIE